MLFYRIRRFVLTAALIPACLFAYTPKLYKPPTTTSLVIVDCAKDRFGPTLQSSGATWRNFEVTLALRTIQGIVNRTSSAKLYLLNLAYTPNSYYPSNIEQMFLDNDIVPTSLPRTTAVLDNTRTYPALHYLITTYASYLSGVVKYADIPQDANGYYAGDDKQVFGAITAAAQLDAVPVSASLNTWLASDGFSLPTRADISGLSGTNAWTWTFNNYFTANTGRSFIGRAQMIISNVSANVKPDYPVTQIDYFVAARAFIDTLDTNNSAELALLPQLYTTANYPLGTPTTGRSPEDRNTDDRGQRGYPHFHLHGPNFSVMASFPSTTGNLTPAPVPAALPSTNTDVFVALYVTDGDNISFSNYKYYIRFLNSPDVGAQLVNFGLSPNLFDLNPRLLEYYSDTQATPATNVSFVANMLLVPGLGADLTSTAWPATTAWINNALDNTNGMFRGYNCLGGSNYDSFVTQIHTDSALRGYRGPYPPTTTAPQIQLLSNGTPSEYISGNAPRTEDTIRYYADRSTNTAPLFVVASLGDSSDDPFTMAKTVANDLLATPNGKTYKFVSAADLLATWKAYSGGGSGTTLFADDFEDGNFTANPVWTPSGGTWQVGTSVTKRLQQTATGTVSSFIVGGSAWSDYSVSATVRMNALGTGSSTLVLGGRYVSTNTRYNVAYYPSTQQLKIVKRVNGTSTDLAVKTLTLNVGTDYIIRFYAKGTTLKAFVNGLEELSATDSAITSGKPYFATYNMTAEVDRFVVSSE